MAPGCCNRGKQNDISFHQLPIKTGRKYNVSHELYILLKTTSKTLKAIVKRFNLLSEMQMS